MEKNKKMKGKVISLFPMLLLFRCVGYSQYFEGEIVYSNEFSSKILNADPGIDSELRLVCDIKRNRTKEHRRFDEQL